METTTNAKSIIELISKGGITAVLTFIVIYFGGSFLNSMQQMQKDLSSIRVQLVKIQSSIITQQHVEKMIQEKIKLLQYKYHGSSK